jgi:enamine deaminase RidA (YjgF/YER057c/UK114 family)
MAVAPGAGLEARHADYNPLYEIHHSSGYSPGLAAGDYRFVPGQTAECRDHAVGGIDPEARVPPGLWKGTPIKSETEFIIQKKLVPSLKAAGAGLDTVVCAQVYLRDRADVPGFNEVWHSYFKNPPATTIIATETPGFIVPEERIEINTISLAQAGATKAVAIESGVPPLFHGQVNAVKAGDLLFLSGLIGVEGGKLVAGAIVDERQPYFGIPIKAELKSILRQAGTICAAAGASLKNSVRIQLFFANLADLPASLEVLHEAFEGAPLPLSAIEVPWLPVPNAKVLASFWVHANDA